MKAKLQYWVQWLREGAVQVFKDHPVELLLILYGCVGCFLIYEMDWASSCNTKFVLAPIFATLALVVNNLAGKTRWRILYWVSWLPIIPLSLWGELAGWLSSTQGLVTCLILLPLAVLACRRAFGNERFICDVVVWLRSALLAAVFTSITLGLFAAILFSTTYIFGMDGPWIEHVFIYVVILLETLAMPVLFLMMADRWRDSTCCGGRFLDVLFNYIVTPALLVYTVILYLYTLKILVIWSLPRGGVAYLVFGFTLLALLVKSLQLLVQKRIYDWFFDRFSLIALPLQVLFWAGVTQRVSEYGLTQPRVWLVACGGLMTLCVLLFLMQRTGRYLYVCLLAMVVFFVLAYVPLANPSRVAIHSQVNRVERMARAVDWLGDDGRLEPTLVETVDTVHAENYRRLYDALLYVEKHDQKMFDRFGVLNADVLLGKMPSSLQQYCRWGYFSDQESCFSDWFRLEVPENAALKLDGSYPNVYPNLSGWGENKGFWFGDDTLRLFLGDDESVWKISAAKLLEAQIARCGFVPTEYPDVSPEQLAKLFLYEDDFCRIIFRDINFQKPDSVLQIREVSIGVVMTR